MTASATDTVIVGAGISGLSCAARLHGAGRSVLVLEKDADVGGVLRSENLPGVGIIDHGPQTIRSGDPELLAEFRSLGLEDDRRVAAGSGSRRYVLWDDRLVPLPHSPGAFLTSPILSPAAKIRLLREPFVRTSPGRDESVEDFFRHRLGAEVAERLVDPFVSGVYAGHTGRLSMEAVFPALKAGVEARGSLFRWGLARARASRRGRDGADRTRPELFSFREGLGQWPRALAATLGPERVRTGVGVREVRPNGGGWTVSTDAGTDVEARRVVLAVPAPAVAELLRGLSAPALRSLAELPHAAVSTVHLAWRRDAVGHPMDGFGYLCPSSQGREVLGVLWISSLFPDRVAEGCVLTTTFVGGARAPERASLPPERLIALAAEEHRQTLGARGEPFEARVVTYALGIPQYEFGHLDRVESARGLEDAWPGLFLTGSWRGGVSVPDCWKGGRAAAERVLAGSTTSSGAGSRAGSPPPPSPAPGRPGPPTGPGAEGT